MPRRNPTASLPNPFMPLRSLGWRPVAAAGIRVPHGHPLVQDVLGRCRLSRGLELSDFGERVQRFVEEQVVLSDALMKLLGQRREWP